MKTSYLNFLKIETIAAFAVAFSLVSYWRILGNGPDHTTYVKIFSSRVVGVEPFWDFLRANIDFKEDTVFFLYSLIAIISLSIKLSILGRSRLSGIPITLYLATFYFLHEYIQVRVALGLAAAYIALSIRTKAVVSSIILYCFPALFHYSLAPLVLLAVHDNKRAFFIMFLLLISAFLLGLKGESFYVIALAKFGDNSHFNILNLLSAYLLFLLGHFYFAFFSSCEEPYRKFYMAALLFSFISIPFGFFQFGTAYFRFQEISASLLLPAAFAVMNIKIRRRWLYAVVYSGYYLVLAIKIHRDLL